MTKVRDEAEGIGDWFTVGPAPIAQLAAAMLATLYGFAISFTIIPERVRLRSCPDVPATGVGDYVVDAYPAAAPTCCWYGQSFRGATRDDAVRELWNHIFPRINAVIVDDLIGPTEPVGVTGIQGESKVPSDGEGRVTWFTAVPIPVEQIAATMLAICHGAPVRVRRRPQPGGYDLEIEGTGFPATKVGQIDQARSAIQLYGATRHEAVRELWKLAYARMADLVNKPCEVTKGLDESAVDGGVGAPGGEPLEAGRVQAPSDGDQYTIDPVPLLQLAAAMFACYCGMSVEVRETVSECPRGKYMLRVHVPETEDSPYWGGMRFYGATRGDTLRALWDVVACRMYGRVWELDDSCDLRDKAPFNKLLNDASAFFTVRPVSIEHIAVAMLAIFHGTSIVVRRQSTSLGYEFHVSGKGVDLCGKGVDLWPFQKRARADAIRELWSHGYSGVLDLVSEVP